MKRMLKTVAVKTVKPVVADTTWHLATTARSSAGGDPAAAAGPGRSGDADLGSQDAQAAEDAH